MSPPARRREDAIELKINGVSRSFDGDPERPLAWYLRGILWLTGTKFGYGIGLWGACTVYQNREAARSCSTRVKSEVNAEITIIEGLNAGDLHTVQKAWTAHKVPQCGDCQPSQIMQAAALLKSKPHPTDHDIDEIMRGNICRCGTYQRIQAAIKTAAGEGA